MNYAAWAEWYDTVYSTEGSSEIDFYVDLAQHSGGPVLEIGVGTGRIAIPTARAGIDIVGIASSPPMLEAARARVGELDVRGGRPGGRRTAHAHGSHADASHKHGSDADAQASRSPRNVGTGPHASASHAPGKIELIEADMRTLDLGRKFRLVTMPARALLLATTPEEQVATLKAARRHLARGGRLALNVFVPDEHMLSDDTRSPFFWDEVVNPSNGRRCILWALNRFDTTTQMNDGLQIIEELDERSQVARKVYLDVRLRYLHVPELRLML